MTERHEFIVVGGGLVGLSATRELAWRGHDVVCVEQSTVGNERSGSKGPGRIFRYGYVDALYVKMAMESLPGWQRLSEESGVQLLDPTGMLSFGYQINDLANAVAEAGAHAAVITGEEAMERFPLIQFSGECLFEPTAGVLDAPAVLSALKASATAAGAGVREDTALVSADSGGDRVQLELGSGRLECGVVLLCGGAFSEDLASLAGLDARGMFRPSLQQVAYLELESGSGASLPAFVERGDHIYYGCPLRGFGRYKIGIHDPGETVNPATASLEDDPESLELLSRLAERLFPALDPVPVSTERCFYDNAPGDDFVIDRVGQVVIAGGTSGHGFKFGPIWGEALADLAEGTESRWPLRRFALRR